MAGKIYNVHGELQLQEVTQEEFLQSICPGSIIAVHSDSLLSNAILFFKPGFAFHDEFYIGKGHNMTLSAEVNLGGTKLRSLKRHFKHKDIRLKVYTKANLTVQELEILKDKAYELLTYDKGYPIGEIISKAWDAILDAILKPFHKTHHGKNFIDPFYTACSDKMFILYNAIYSRVVKQGITIEESAPSDIDEFMDSNEAKIETWYTAGTWNVS